jgi:membrane peptidoglycan carboxypeptidase
VVFDGFDEKPLLEAGIEVQFFNPIRYWKFWKLLYFWSWYLRDHSKMMIVDGRIGYTPSVVVGMWGGNNDNTPIDKKVAGLVLAPIWHKAMAVAIGTSSYEYFPDPLPNTSSKPILRGSYCSSNGIHTILNSVIKDNPDGEYPSYPANDSQYDLWETGIQNWLNKNPLPCQGTPLETTTPTTIEIATTTVQ